MDQIDQKILELIRENARMSYSDIGKAAGISRISAKKRMDSMEKAGVIGGYHTVIDEEKTRGGLRYIIDIEAIPEEYAAVVKTLTARRCCQNTDGRQGARADLQHNRRLPDPLRRPQPQSIDHGIPCDISVQPYERDPQNLMAYFAVRSKACGRRRRIWNREGEISGSLTTSTESTGRDSASLFIWGRNLWRHHWIIWNFLCVLIIVCGEQGSGT